MTTNVFSGNSRIYYGECLAFIKETECKYHRKPDILEIAKYIQEEFGGYVLLCDFRKTIAMLLIEEKIQECLFYEDN